MRILVYDGSPDFGGHQVMACRGIEALTAAPAHDIICLFNPANRKLSQLLPRSDRLQILPAPCPTRKFQGLLNRFETAQINALAAKFRTLRPDRVLVTQGDIEGSSQALLAAKAADIECISYLALPHSRKQMKAKLAPLRDAANRYLFALPDRFIVISESMRQLLKQQGATAPINIVSNGIPPPQPLTPSAQRPVTLGLFGRIEFNQKRQDFMLETFCAYPEVFRHCRLLIVGSGPDGERLAKRIDRCNRRDDITLHPWQDDVQRLYAGIDVLMLPSRFEGVPLVMLEALQHGIPVLASRCDGMQDLLPADWTFEPGNAAALAETFSAAMPSWRQHIGAVQNRVAEMTLDAFQAGFRRAVTGT